MPIRPENRDKYPDDWPEISRRIRFDRAGGRCECDGRCSHGGKRKCLADDAGRCLAQHGRPNPATGSTVVLTVMHLEHDLTKNEDEDLMAGCQLCHNCYDAPERRRGIAMRRPLPLFDQQDGDDDASP